MTVGDTPVGYLATSIEARQAVYDMALQRGILVEPLTATDADGVTETWIAGGNLHERVVRKAWSERVHRKAKVTA